MFVADVNGDGRGDIISFGGRQLSVNIQKETGWSASNVSIDLPVAQAAFGRCNRDKFDDIVLLTDSVRQLEVYLAKPRGQFSFAWKGSVEGTFDDILCADLDNDKRTDILLYGKKELGLTVYRGKGNGTYGPKIVLLPEYSYSTARVADLNGDGVNDIIAANWVSNTLLVFTGFGQMKFSDPVEIPFRSEPSILCADRMDDNESPDIIAGLPSESSYAVLSADGLGGYVQRQVVRLEGEPSDICTGDINGDGHHDVCVLMHDRQTLRVDLNDGSGTLTQRAGFFAGVNPVGLCLIPQNEVLSAAVFDAGLDNIHVFRNASAADSSLQESSFAVGLEPTSVHVLDVNHDGWNDIITSNMKSHDLSLLLNNGSGRYTGAVFIGGVSSSGFLFPVPGNDTVSTFIGTHPDSGNISIVELNTENFSSTTFSLPTQGPAEILSVGDKGRLRFGAFERDKGGTAGSFIDYERIAYSRFVEKEIGPVTAPMLLSTMICNIDDDGVPDFVFINYDKRRHKENLYYALGKSAERSSGPVLLQSFPFSEVVPANLWSCDLDGNGRPDILLNLRQPENSLIMVWGDKDSVFRRSPGALKQPVSIVRKDQLQILDMNGDGLPDLVCQNDARKALQLFLHKRDGSFQAPTRLAASEGLGAFVLADVNRDKIPELILTDRSQGRVQVISLEER
jgi:hypothetical protein